MGERTDLPYMPLWIDDLRRATLGWPSDAAFLYRLLLEVHWQERGVLPADLMALRGLVGIPDWRGPRWVAAWEFIQGNGTWKGAKFLEDSFGLYNQRGRELLRSTWDRMARGRQGALKQHGCTNCRRRRGSRVDLGDGWIRHCPKCKIDLWRDFEEIPWLPDLLPGVLSAQAPGAKEAALASEHWSAILTRLQGHIPPDDFKTFFKPLRVISEQGGKLVVRCPNERFMHTIEDSYAPAIQQAAGDASVLFTFEE